MIHVIIQIKDQETFFKGKSFPHYEVGWKLGSVFTTWSGKVLDNSQIQYWKEI